MFHELQMEWIRMIHQFRNEYSDLFFSALNYFDRLEFYFVLIPIVWLCAGWKTGFRLYVILQLSMLANHYLKAFFLSPRPFHLDPTLGIIHVNGLGFPSGAAQTVILLSGLMLIYWKSAWKWLVIALYILLVSFSRVYLGVHFFTDILAGWFVGGVLLAIYVYIFPLIEKTFEKLSTFSLFALSQLIPAGLLYASYSKAALETYGVAMGIGYGIYLVYLFHTFILPPKGFWDMLLRSVIGVGGTFLIFALTTFIPSPYISRFILGLWLSFGTYLACRTLLPWSKTDVET